MNRTEPPAPMRPLPNFEPCPVCHERLSHFLVHADARDYFACDVCEARYVDARDYPSPEAEHAQYLLHQNHIDDPRYRQFLSKVVRPLLGRLSPGSRGLDYGCGPGPALAAMLRDAGHHVAIYDPFFAPDRSVLDQTYDFVTCTETVEHFHHPNAEFDRLMDLVRPLGWLAVMTCFQTDDAKFAKWHYRGDPTHVVFYREATFRWLAARHGWSCELPVKDVVLMQRPLPHTVRCR
jgi:SAM-dependent methyltransferase